MKVLIVDNDNIYLKLIKRKLDSSRDEIETEENPVRALKKIQRENYDLVISDYNMKEMNGLELFKRIKVFFKSMPVIINTAHNDFNIKKEAILNGIYAFYNKASMDMIINDMEILNSKIS